MAAPERSTATLTTGGLPWIEDTAKIAPRDARVLSKQFFDRLEVLEEGTVEHQYARNTLIGMNISLVHFAARRFRNRGNGDLEDIIQVGVVGLIKAIDRFDLTREVEFTSFAVPYIVGEIKRFFRDQTWAVHVPRRLQELRVELAQTKERLEARLNRAPTVAELAVELNLTEAEIIEGTLAANAYTAGPLDAPEAGDTEHGAARPVSEMIGEPESALELFEDLHSLAPLLEQLGARDRRILEMRFGQEMTQSRIGAELGLSQMHVSRLIAGTLAELRVGLLTER
ncbi:SigB/SigF/SigG family RNA polymerase sigma factor [Streptomyces sp. NPDC007346]|uniref:SigB/SigF/SigG family RNA polymerase sigma factor n=1 Tax=Streptomyces sp. NPDC007346 TaxID=3154682 RepID=UPI0034531DB1